MGRKKVVSCVDARTLASAESDFGALPQGKVAMRLLAIIAVGQNRTLDEVARLIRTTRQTISSWVKRYKEGGLALLDDKPKGHRVARLGKVERDVITRWIELGVDAAGAHIHWTVERLRAEIEDVFGIRYGKTMVWQMLRAWGYRLKVPRPRHEKASPKAEKAFKKTPREGPGAPEKVRRKR